METKRFGAIAGLMVAALVLSTVMMPPAVARASDMEWGDLGGGFGEWGGAEIYPDTWGGAEIYPDTWGGAEIYPDTWGGAEIYPDSYDTWGGAEIYPDSYDTWGGAEIYPDSYDTWGGAEIYPDSYDTWGGAEIYQDYYTDSGYYYSTGSGSSAQYYSTPMTISAPKSYSTPSYSYSTPSYSYPSYTPSRPSTPSYPSYPSYPSTNNNCVNNSCNTNTNISNNINNSVNGSYNTNVATVYPAQQQPVIQYTYPIYQTPTYYQQYPQQNTYCVISASQTTITSGQTTYLAWSSSYNTTSATLSEFGSVPTTGTRAVTPYSTRTYVLTVYGPGGSNSCSVTINVGNAAPYVSLSQIPYTGLDLGLIGNAIYWLSLLSFAVAGAYLIVYYKGGAFAFAGAVRSTRAAAPEKRQQAPAAAVAPSHAHAAVHPAHETHADPMAHLPVMGKRSTTDRLVVNHGGHGETPRITIERA